MIEDLRSLDDGLELETDIVVIGGGVAGITLACELADSGLGVIIAESGGLDFDPATQALAAGDSTGVSYYALDAARLRLLGGSSGHWNNRCLRLDPIDFARRPWVPHSGWPLGLEDFLPYYERAHPYATLGPAEYDPASVIPPVAGSLDQRIEGSEHVVVHDTAEPTRFGEVYRARLEEAPGVRVLLFANVTQIVPAPDMNRISRVHARTLEGKRATLSARVFVLACGGIDNARMLLLPSEAAPRGLCVGCDLVGRFFGEHLSADYVFGGVMLGDRGWMEAYRYRRHGIGQVTVNLRLTAEMQERLGLLNSVFTFSRGIPTEPGLDAAVRVLQRLRGGRPLSTRLTDDLWKAAVDVDRVLFGLYGYVRDGGWPKPEESFLASTHIEMAPNPQSRVTLSPTRDALGLPRVSLDMQPSGIDVETIRKASEWLATEMTRLDIARVAPLAWLGEGEPDWGADIRGGFHHMGTTRMGADAASGVVDANCRVHGMANLYVAGSSVFPTFGAATPTLSIIALTIRLGDHLRQILGG